MKTSPALALLATLFAAPALAEDAALAAEVAALKETLAEQRAQLDAQARLLEAQSAQLEALSKKLGAPGASAPAPALTLTDARPAIVTPEGRTAFALRANVQLDGALYGESPDAGAADSRRGSVGATNNRETNGARDFSDGAYFRRARFGFEGNLASDFSYRLLVELGGAGSEGPTRINDAWIAYTGLAPFTFQLGAFSPPANMDDGTSPEDLPFIERASVSELSRSLGGADGRIGLAVKANGERWMSALALTTRTVFDAEVHDSQFAVVARAGGLLARGDDFDVHAGASGTYVFSPPDAGSSASPRRAVRFRDRPEIRVDGTRLVDTGAIGADHASVIGAEFGARWKNVYVQGERFWFDVDRDSPSALADPSFGGWYVQGSWMMTGESRRYHAATGSFRGPRVKSPVGEGSGSGAWELAARYSALDLNFREGLAGSAATPDSVRGGEQKILALGVNWYLNANFKVMMNYLLVDVDRLNPAGPGNLSPFGPAPGTPASGARIGQELDVFAVRTQFAF
jgi:phosphate-selective porin OprO/OprP